MPGDKFTIRQNDTRASLRRILKNADGSAIDLSDASSVTFHMLHLDTSVVKVNRAAVVVDAAAGIVEYRWLAVDTDTPGYFKSEFEVTFATGDVITVPNDGDMTVRIVGELA